MDDKLNGLMKILEEEFGDSIVYECRNGTCVVNLLFTGTNLIIHTFKSRFLRVETERIRRKPVEEVFTIPMVKTLEDLEGTKLICDLPSSCMEYKEAFKLCVSAVIQALFTIDDNLSRKLLDKVLSMVRELNSQGLTGNEIYRILVDKYKVPSDLAETMIESYYALMDGEE
ncbi:MAG: hypothetical protein F7B59_06885 [Desulfurococcales archaeon]|nr:hypothetical protein [Desulfurococcales archaeon]